MPGSRARLGVIFLTVFIDLAGFGLVIPILPYYAERFGAGGFGFGLLVGVFSGMQFVATILLGRLSDRYGRRPVLLASIVVAALGYTMFGLAGSYGWLLVARALAGFAGGNISVAQAYIADVTSPAERARGMGLVGAAFGLGFVVGPAIGGVAGHYGGPLAAGLVAAGLCVVNFVSAYLLLPESLAVEHRASRPLVDAEHLVRGLTDPLMRPAFLVYGIVPFAFSGYIVTLPLYAERAFGWHEREMGWFFTMVGVVSATVQGWGFAKIQRRVSDRALIIWGLFGMALAIAMMPVGRVGGSLYAWAALLAFSNSILSPAITGLVSRLAGISEQGAMLGAAQGLSALGRLTGPLLFGMMFDGWGPVAAFVGSAGV
ncbi:MAG TPA: MFS transporter, partial [Gemmatimonadales bacterium]|nr:MFS transporter [Gemmatimonadales bacterium]